MTQSQFSNLQTRFRHYLQEFRNADGNFDPVLQLKVDHTKRVTAEARSLSKDLAWPLPEQLDAEAAGLLHDLGRFSQFKEFGTFCDRISVDHGERGAAAIAEAGWLKTFTEAARRAILESVRYHNRLTIPADLDDYTLALLKIVRDADKLDIYQVVLGCVGRDGFQDLPTMLPHVTLDRNPSPAFVEGLFNRSCASLNEVKTLADFLLMEVSWVYDFNYVPSLQRLIDRQILPRIFRHIISDDRVQAYRMEVEQHLAACVAT